MTGTIFVIEGPQYSAPPSWTKSSIMSTTTSARRMVLDALEDRRDPLAAADTERSEPVPALALPELGDDRERESRARGAERVAEGDRAAVHVRLLAIEAELLFDGE